MKKDAKNASRKVFIILVCIVCLLMISSSFTLISGYSSTIEEESGNVALEFIESAANNLRSGIAAYKLNVAAMSKEISSMEYENEIDFLSKLNLLGRSENFGDIMFIRYFKDGGLYDSGGDRIEDVTVPASLKKLVEKKVLSCVGIISDEKYNISTTAFCAPLEDCEYADAIVAYYPVASIVSHSINRI